MARVCGDGLPLAQEGLGRGAAGERRRTKSRSTPVRPPEVSMLITKATEPLTAAGVEKELQSPPHSE